jgi:hypothetical protein
MSDVLKGNFKTKQVVTTKDKAAETLEDRFEREALRRLGGSIAFVSKKKIMWDAKESGVSKTDQPAPQPAGDDKNSAVDAAATPKAANGR